MHNMEQKNALPKSIRSIIRLGKRKEDLRHMAMEQLAEAAERLALGDTDISPMNAMDEETSRLAEAITHLAARLRKQEKMAEQIATGSFGKVSELGSKDDPLSMHLNQIAVMFQTILTQLAELERNQAEGKLDVFLPEDTYKGVYADAVKHVNAVLKLHVTASQATAECIEAFADGDFDAQLRQVPSTWAFLHAAVSRLKESQNALVEGMRAMSAQQNAGDLDAFIQPEHMQGCYAEMAQFVNAMVKSHITVKKKAMACIAEISRGNFDAELERFPGKKAFVNENIEQLRSTIKNFISEMQTMSAQQDAGDLDAFMPADRFEGAFAAMAESVNTMVKGHIAVKRKAMACIAQFARGNFEAKLERFPGKKAFVNDAIESLRKDLKAIHAEIGKLIDASQQGNLSERGNTADFHGGWKELIEGLNRLLDGVVMPVQEAAQVLSEMQNGNLSVKVSGNYKGDHAKIKNALNSTISSLNALLHNAISSAQEVGAGSNQVSDASQALAQGATEQASSLEEVTATISEVSAQTRANAESAAKANGHAETARTEAAAGNQKMAQMLSAMNTINESSAHISQIIKVIDGIAFQTNILALNAAVEAARAGQYGKGFAVVAEEVRNLASKSAEASQKTAELIEQSASHVETGVRIAHETAETLKKITESVDKTSDIVSNIAEASNQQATAISQIDQSISQVSTVVQNNSALAEESAASSEELSAQAERLMQLVSEFTL